MMMTFLVGLTTAVWLLALVTGLRIIRARGVIARLRGILLAAIFGSVGAVLTALLLVLQAFQAFSGETLIAQVTIRPLAAEEFELTYTPLPASRQRAGQAAGAATTVRLTGDQWSLSGGIVKWHPWLTAMGLHSYHRPTRIAGQFSNLARSRTHPPTVYPLSGSTDWLWEAFYRADPYLPFIEAVYGSSAYVYVESGQVYEIYVTPSGYLIKRRSF